MAMFTDMAVNHTSFVNVFGAKCCFSFQWATLYVGDPYDRGLQKSHRQDLADSIVKKLYVEELHIVLVRINGISEYSGTIWLSEVIALGKAVQLLHHVTYFSTLHLHLAAEGNQQRIELLQLMLNLPSNSPLCMLEDWPSAASHPPTLPSGWEASRFILSAPSITQRSLRGCSALQARNYTFIWHSDKFLEVNCMKGWSCLFC